MQAIYRGAALLAATALASGGSFGVAHAQTRPAASTAPGAEVSEVVVTGSRIRTSPLDQENFTLMENPDADHIIFMQSGEPESLYCADETDGEAIRACLQTNESLLAYETGGTKVVPALATSYEASTDGLTWTFHLRDGVKFHDGSALTANDVVMSYAVQWDAGNPLHTGNTGVFDYFSSMYGGFLNAPKAS